MIKLCVSKYKCQIYSYESGVWLPDLSLLKKKSNLNGILQLHARQFGRHKTNGVSIIPSMVLMGSTHQWVWVEVCIMQIV